MIRRSSCRFLPRSRSRKPIDCGRETRPGATCFASPAVTTAGFTVTWRAVDTPKITCTLSDNLVDSVFLGLTGQALVDCPGSESLLASDRLPASPPGPAAQAASHPIRGFVLATPRTVTYIFRWNTGKRSHQMAGLECLDEAPSQIPGHRFGKCLLDIVESGVEFLAGIRWRPRSWHMTLVT